MTKTRLSELQIAVVNVLWERGETTVAGVRDALADRNLATTTVATVLKRLLEAGVVEREKDGREYLYRAAVPKVDVRSSMVGDLVDWLFGGDVRALIHHLLAHHLVSEAGAADPADVDRLRARLGVVLNASPGSGAGLEAGSPSPDPSPPASGA